MAHGPEFFQTQMGRTFFEGTLPRLQHAIARLADLVGGPREYKVLESRISPGALEQSLNDLGNKGYRVVGVVDRQILLERIPPR